MFNLRPRDLTPAGWWLLIVSMGLGVLVEVPIALWARNAVDRQAFRIWAEPVALLLALPGIVLAMLVFYYGRRFLARAGIVVVRPGTSAAE